ncbi:MAG: hypothetical protein ACRDJM_07930 [Actinomycetota bacterium]
MPGFVDVYYHPEEPVPFRPLFLNRVPRQAFARGTSAPVAFDVLPGEIVDYGPGPLPDLNDTFCAGIRPGALLIIGNAICTAGFIFSDGTNDYVSTAGHCLTAGQSASVPNVGVIGTAVFSTGAGGVGNDFALIQVVPAVASQVSAEVCNWAGPTQAFSGSSIQGRRLYQTGQGLGVTNVPRPKVGVGLAVGATSFQYIGNSVPGDSGSPVRLDAGDGLGLLTAGLAIPPVPLPINFGTTVSRGIALSGIPNLSLKTVSWIHGVE